MNLSMVTYDASHKRPDSSTEALPNRTEFDILGRYDRSHCSE